MRKFLGLTDTGAYAEIKYFYGFNSETGEIFVETEENDLLQSLNETKKMTYSFNEFKARGNPRVVEAILSDLKKHFDSALSLNF